MAGRGRGASGTGAEGTDCGTSSHLFVPDEVRVVVQRFGLKISFLRSFVKRIMSFLNVFLILTIVPDLSAHSKDEPARNQHFVRTAGLQIQISSFPPGDSADDSLPASPKYAAKHPYAVPASPQQQQAADVAQWNYALYEQQQAAVAQKAKDKMKAKGRTTVEPSGPPAAAPPVRAGRSSCTAPFGPHTLTHHLVLSHLCLGRLHPLCVQGVVVLRHLVSKKHPLYAPVTDGTDLCTRHRWHRSLYAAQMAQYNYGLYQKAAAAQKAKEKAKGKRPRPSRRLRTR